MTVTLTTEQEAKLEAISRHSGRSAEELTQAAVDRFLIEEEEFRAKVLGGIRDADAGRFVSSEEVWARVEGILQAK